MNKTIKLTPKGIIYVEEYMLPGFEHVDLEALHGKDLGGDEFELPVAWRHFHKPDHVWVLYRDEYEYID